MSPLQDNLIFFGILILLGVSYYFFQKRRIIRVSKEDILADVEQFRFELNKFNEEHPDSSALKVFNNEFEVIYLSGDFSQLIKLEAEGLNDELKQFYEALCQQIIDHLKVSPSF